MPTAMIAMGGNSISPIKSSGTISEQFFHVRKSIDGISYFVENGYNICINHGNGPQVGNELLRMDLTKNKVPPLPLGVCVASTQGSIGYMIQQTLQNKLRDLEIDREVVTMVSQVIIDENAAIADIPNKFIGPRYSSREADKASKNFGWSMKEQENGNFRRVVPSPMPKYIMHGQSIKALVNRGTIVIASGGGGIPVYNDKNGHLEGIDAVIDKDHTAAKMGRIIRANELWIITDVDYIYLNYGTKKQKKIKYISRQEIEKLYEKGVFQEGSIAPKVRAAIHFLKHHGKKVVITSVSNIEKAFHGLDGTEIRN